MPRMKLATAERRQFVIAMHTAGATYPQVAQAAVEKFGRENLPLSWDARYANKDVRETVRKIYGSMKPQLTEHRMIQMQRYEAIIRAHWPRAMAGHLGATDRVLKALKDESYLLGIDAPHQIDVRVQHIDQRIERLMEALATRRQGEAAPALGAGDADDDDTVVDGTARYL